MVKNKSSVQRKTAKKIDYSFNPTKDDLVFIPLGGTDEVGMNLSVLGHDNEWLIIDCGVSFYDRLGIEVLTADPTFIVKKHKNLKGILITHAHEDHIGAVEYLWPLLRCPVFATPFAATVLKQKLQEKPWFSEVKIEEVKFQKKLQIGKFEIEFLPIAHSIPEPGCIVIKTPLGTIVHTGDWKFDSAPLLGEKVAEEALRKIGDKGVLAYFSDSTNIFTKDDISSEEKVRNKVTEIVLKNKEKRITMVCFSSNIVRLETAMLAAQAAGRKVLILGRSLQRMITAAKKSGYLKNLPSFIDDKTAISMPPEKVFIICTGSQGETRSALVRIAQNLHPVVKLGEADLVLFSSRVIPGNEKSIGNLHSLLARAGSDIITSAEEEIHVSGHPSQKAIKKMYKLLRPEIVVPVHGEARHIIAQAHFAKQNKIKHVITPRNGTVISLSSKNPEILGIIPTNRWAVDGKRMIVFNSSIIKERTKISEQGSAFITLNFDKNSLQEIWISLIGVTEKGKQSEELHKQLEQELRIHFQKNQKSNKSDLINELVEKMLKSTIKAKTGKEPIVKVHVVLN